MLRLIVAILITIQVNVSLAVPTWSTDDIIPIDGRANPYELDDEEYKLDILKGKIHTQIYPVQVTGALIPYYPVRRFVEGKTIDPLRFVIQNIFKAFMNVRTLNDVFAWVGLHPYPKETDTGVYSVPYPNGVRPKGLMGVGLINRNGAEGFTFSCAACHSSNLFGKTVLGLTNRFPRANETFMRGKFLLKFTHPTFFKFYNHATNAEISMLKQTKRNLNSVGMVRPIQLGLDTSLAQVALSLNRRADDAYATQSDYYANHPRQDVLDKIPADSKPAVWWNLKYKNRWLSDGSVVGGNPIITNLLWNEIGRGTNLHDLEKWIRENQNIIQELTTAVFSIEAPRITDFFSESAIELGRAKHGEVLFNQNCAKCHGHYEKKWSEPGAEILPIRDQIQTTHVKYKDQTKVVDVGTDKYRYLGMKSLEQLNRLEISKLYGVRIEAQKGYVPPPLVGIWARWPYMHNNSMPSLCSVLTRSDKRPQFYYSGEALNTKTDFDFQCNGYPLGTKTPSSWKTKEHFYSSKKIGLSNYGHDDRIFIKNGEEIFSAEDKKDLIQFLQTL